MGIVKPIFSPLFYSFHVLLLNGLKQWPPTPGPRTGTGLWVTCYRASPETITIHYYWFIHFVILKAKQTFVQCISYVSYRFNKLT